MFGTTGALLRINLSKETSRKERLDEGVVRKHFGGRGLGAKILFDELKPGIDPLGPENKLIFAAGPLTGAPFGGNARYTVMGKNPLTGGWGETSGGGFFGPEIKYAGYDLIVVEGAAEKPVYVYVQDDDVQIRGAHHLWGKEPTYCQDAIIKEVGKEAHIAHIGIGGENLVRYAAVIADLVYAAGRTGMGAVMGSKKLKSVAVYGTKKKISIADEEAFKKVAKKIFDTTWGPAQQILHEHGEDGFLQDLNASGRLPTKNFQQGTYEHANDITGQRMTEKYLKGRRTCYACRTTCYRVVESDAPYKIDPRYGGPEYENAAALGSLVMVDDLLAICKAHELCNRFTLDTISMGVVLAWAMECYDKGILTKEQLNGIDLKWGNKDGMLKLIEDIARRKGIGDLLAEGVARASKKTGKGSEKFAMHVKGLEVAMHEPRGKKGFGVSMAVSNRGGCHVTMIDHDDFLTLDSNLVPELGFTHTIGLLDTSPEKTKLVKFAEDFKALYDSMDICMLMVYPWGPQIQVLPELVRSITGWDISLQELQRVGERAFDMTRAFNVREGINRKDDTLPPRFMEPLPDGVYKGQYLSQSELDSMLDSYYTHRGWTRDGIPTREKLRELEIEYIADKLSLPK